MGYPATRLCGRDGSQSNSSLGALARNVGEVIGVFGDVKPVTTKWLGFFDGGYSSSIQADNLRELEKIVAKAICKDTEKRYKNCTELSVDLTHVFNKLGKLQEEIAEQERFNMVKQLEFFSEFSYPEIWEVLNSSKWEVFDESDQVVTEGELDDSFYIIVSGEVEVSKNGRVLGKLAKGDCFGEMGFMSNTERSATVVTKNGVSLMRVNAMLIEQASLQCQLRFHKVFLKSLIQRLSRTSDMAVTAHNGQTGG